MEDKNPKNYENIIEFLDLNEIGKHKAAAKNEKTRRIMLELREKRKTLIKNYLKS